MIDEKLLKNEERAVFALRSLYRSFGYLPYKMSKFEEYDLYQRNKDFLVSDRIITFTDTNGKLMALKPDVTLSIIKNGEDAPGVKQKVCYDENVYRVSGRTHEFRELTQAGLECIGDVDLYDIFEVVSLAARSLALISEDYVLDVAHLGVLAAFMDEIGADDRLRREIAGCIAGKNRHELMHVCREHGVAEEWIGILCRFVGIYGDMEHVLAELGEICVCDSAKEALGQLRALSDLLRGAGLADHVRFDFSIVNDMNYYNGIVFKGFLSGICEGGLSGGQYDQLMRRLGRRSGAVGFALYLDLLEGLEPTGKDSDVDVLVLYHDRTDAAELVRTVQKLTGAGYCVSVQKAIPAKLRYRKLLDLRKEDEPK